MVKDMGIIMTSAPSHKHTTGTGLAEEPTHKAGTEHADAPKKKAGMHVQTRRDTTEPISGEPDYVAPEDWPTQHITELNKANGSK